MSNTVHCLIEPRDPLIFRDGRPFAAGIMPRSMPWPHPTVVVGTARTQLGLPGPFDDTLVSQLLEIRQRGPLLAYKKDVAAWNLALPRPLDAAVFPSKEGYAENFELYPCRPTRLEVGEGTDLSMRSNSSRLLPVFADLPNVKPPKNLPTWWRWEQYRAWLLHGNSKSITLSRLHLGLPGPTRQTRIHVSINPATKTAAEGQLFATEGMEFASVREKQVVPDRLALYSELTLPEALEAKKLRGVIAVGGERRLAQWNDAGNLLSELEPPMELLEQIAKEGLLRLILITPGSFKKGWLPEWLDENRTPPVEKCSVQFELKGAAVGRFVPISGWDLRYSRPKPTRFLAPSGSVYFLKIIGKATVEDLRALWLQPISDNEGDRRDGFGLCVLGAWVEDVTVQP